MPERIIVAGSRTLSSRPIVANAIKLSPHNPFHGELVTGDADGVDSIAREFVQTFRNVELNVFPANWDEYGKSAGPRRNTEMAEYADGLIAVWNGKSSGTKDIIDKALERNLDVYVRVIESQSDIDEYVG